MDHVSQTDNANLSYFSFLVLQSSHELAIETACSRCTGCVQGQVYNVSGEWSIQDRCQVQA